MKSGASDTALALGSRVGVLLFSLAIQSTLAWALGPDGRGSYAVCLLFATILATAFTFGVDRAGQYFSASGKMDVADSVRAMIVALVVGSVLAALLGRAMLELDLSFFGKADRSSFYVALVVVPFIAIQNSLVMILIGMRRMVAMAIVSLTSVVVQLAAALILVLVLRLGVDGALWSIVVAELVTIAVAAAFLRREGWLTTGRTTWSQLTRLLGYGIRYYVAKLSTMVHFRIGTLILAFFVPPMEIGLFAAASQLVARVTIVSKSVEMALFSRIAVDREGRPDLVASSARVTMLAAAALLGFITALSWPIVMILLSPQFARSVPLIWIIAPGILVRSGSNVLMTYFMGTNRPAICSWSVGLGMLANFLAILVLLPVLGLAGAAWAMTIGYAVSGAILMEAFRRSTGMTLLSTWWPRRDDIVMLTEGFRMVARSAFRRIRAGGSA